MKRRDRSSAGRRRRRSPAVGLRGPLVFIGFAQARGAAQGRAALRAAVHLFGVRRSARGAEAERTGVPALHVRRFGGRPEHQLLGADADAIALGQLRRPLDALAVDAASVAAAKVIDDGRPLVDDDPGVPAGDGGVEQRDVAVVGRDR